MAKLLALDLSTTCTGWSIWDTNSKTLLEYGIIKAIWAKPKPKKKYELQIAKLDSMTDQILDLIKGTKGLEIIAIEEINRGKNRFSQKILDGLHYVLLFKMDLETLDKVEYKDSDGIFGWRSDLKLTLSEADKKYNKESRLRNKKLSRGNKLPIITKKHLACRFVNRKFRTKFNVDKNKTDSDIVDSIGLGYAYLWHNLNKKKVTIKAKK